MHPSSLRLCPYVTSAVGLGKTRYNFPHLSSCQIVILLRKKVRVNTTFPRKKSVIKIPSNERMVFNGLLPRILDKKSFLFIFWNMLVKMLLLLSTRISQKCALEVGADPGFCQEGHQVRPKFSRTVFMVFTAQIYAFS